MLRVLATAVSDLPDWQNPSTASLEAPTPLPRFKGRFSVDQPATQPPPGYCYRNPAGSRPIRGLCRTRRQPRSGERWQRPGTRVTLAGRPDPPSATDDQGRKAHRALWVVYPTRNLRPRGPRGARKALEDSAPSASFGRSTSRTPPSGRSPACRMPHRERRLPLSAKQQHNDHDDQQQTEAPANVDTIGENRRHE